MIQIFNYNNSDVTFKTKEGVVYVNATEMAKQFGKSTKDWLRTDQSVAIISEISVGLKRLTADLVYIRQGGTPNEQGTWMH